MGICKVWSYSKYFRSRMIKKKFYSERFKIILFRVYELEDRVNSNMKKRFFLS